MTEKKRKTLKLEPKAAAIALQKTLDSQTANRLMQMKSEKQREERAKKERHKRIGSALQWLCETFPKAFDRKQPKPLKLKIEADIFSLIPEDSKISKSDVRKAVAFYAGSKQYLKSFLEHEMRGDLNGNECEAILPGHKKFASEKLKALLNNQPRTTSKSAT